MADIVITAGIVVAGSNSNQEAGTAGETITAGQPLYKSSTTGKWMKADANSGTAEAKIPKGVSLHGASLNQPIKVHKSGDLTLNAVLTAGTSYFLSDTAGGICPLADVGTGEDVVQIGIAKSTTVLAVDIQAPGVTL